MEPETEGNGAGNAAAPIHGNSDDTIRGILPTTRRVVLVEASANPSRSAREMMRFLRDRGYDVTPGQSGSAGQSTHGRTVVASLDEAAQLDMVDVFRASEHAAVLTEEVIDHGRLPGYIENRRIGPVTPTAL